MWKPTRKTLLDFQDFPVPIALLDGAGSVVEKNAAWVNLDPIGGLPFVWPLDFPARVAHCLELQQSTVVRSQESKEGGRLFDLWLGPIGDQNDRIIVIAADISIYRQDAIAELIETEVRNAAVVIQGILHEMRNPLAGIKAGLQLLKRRHKDDKLRQDIDEILGDAARIDAVFQELVLLGGALQLHRRKTNLHQILDEAINTMAKVAQEKNVIIERHLDPSLPELDVDSDRLYRVYLNLLMNAVHAAPENSRIRVDTRYERRRWSRERSSRHPIRRAAWVTMISDEGPGIEETAASTLFTPMYTTKPNGTGLGLPISLQIVQAHGGMLTIENAPDGGAIATVVLPIDQVESK